MSFHDFITNLQAGNYSRPIAKTDRGEFCEQVFFNDEDAAKVTDLASFDANASKLKNVRIRQVTGGGSFSSGTKAKFRLSLPIKAKYVAQLQKINAPVTQLGLVAVPVASSHAGSGHGDTPVYEDISISMLTMYHPSPLRIENVQHDAVLSLNDPSDPTAKTVILIPLKASNTGDESGDFFNKIAKHLTTITVPDSVTGLYPETDIPTGNDWNIKSVFWLRQAGVRQHLQGDRCLLHLDGSRILHARGTLPQLELRDPVWVGARWCSGALFYAPDACLDQHDRSLLPHAQPSSDTGRRSHSQDPRPDDEGQLQGLLQEGHWTRSLCRMWEWGS
jgi:hypothetical protein